MTGRIVYDADCGFCTRAGFWIDRNPVAWQDLNLDEVGATPDEAAHFVGYLGAEGRIVALGAPAIARALVARGGAWSAVGYLLDLPGIRWLAARTYPLLAANRHRLPGSTAACRIDPPAT